MQTIRLLKLENWIRPFGLKFSFAFKKKKKRWNNFSENEFIN